MKAITKTDFSFPGQTARYTGKVRDVYSIGNDYIIMVATDRISAFDVVLPRGIPFKGQVLNQIASKFLDATSDIVPNWKISEVDPMVTAGWKCEPYKVEMVIRGYLSGHAWREYRDGKRSLCGVALPDGLVENQKLPEPIITPTTKAAEGHDEDIVHTRAFPARNRDGGAEGPHTRGYQVRVRPPRREDSADGRDPHSGLFKIFLRRRL